MITMTAAVTMTAMVAEEVRVDSSLKAYIIVAFKGARPQSAA